MLAGPQARLPHASAGRRKAQASRRLQTLPRNANRRHSPLTGCKRIANFAANYRIPVALHNVGHMVNTLAAAHFGCSVQNFYRSESRLGGGRLEQQAAGAKPKVRNRELAVPEASGLGIEWNEDYLRANLAPGEPWWD
ncbi:MAG: hypothetical protein F7B06_07875 [Opitutae bacterium]|nr:hypothetical protein [Opitutae bacterium]